jgi:hypothetical protein
MLLLTPALLIAGASTCHRKRVDPTGLKFLNHVGPRSHYDHAARRSSWPLPKVRDCDVLAEFAEINRVLKEEPMEGDVFLQYSPADRRFVRAGIIASIDFTFECLGQAAYLCTTIEAGETRGRRFTSVGADRFIRWVELEWRRHAA